MDYLPLFAKLQGRACLVVGGGHVAHRKTLQILRCGGRVTINAPSLCAELRDLTRTGSITWRSGPFDAELIAAHLLVIAATDDREVNREVAARARDAQQLCNVVDDAELSTFIMPSIVDRSPLVVAVSSGGASPVLARIIRQRLDQWLPQRIGAVARWAAGLREQVADVIPDLRERLRFWQETLDGAPAEHVLAGRQAVADHEFQAALTAAGRYSGIGEAWLVGAGPGDPGLITCRGLQLLQRADAVLYDRLIAQEMLDFARRDASLVCVGKRAGGPSWRQADINRELIQRVREGQRVCRLKGGDPFIFGRGAEEIQALVESGLPYQVVPGITAAAGCAAYAGIPLTHRELASAVTFVTAHRADTGADIDWHSLVRPDQTLVFYMGARILEHVATRLVDAGLDAATPAAVVENGTTTEQRVIGGTLQSIGQRGREAMVAAPAVLIVGRVAELAGQLQWFGGGPDQGGLSALAHTPL
jgi:uroporphyrin-III C-methyltransferase/precorrin-2 dehydrogenase/sirohydrochlorin ferrochelatase